MVTFWLWTFYYVKGKLLLMSRCFMISYHWKTISFFPHMTSFKNRSRFLWKYIHSVDICGWSRVSVTWLHSNSDSRIDHPVVFPRPWLQSNQFYVVCGQQTAFDLREWQAYPLCEFWGQGWECQTASSDWVTVGLSSITYSSLVLLNYLIGVHSIPRTGI